MKRSIRFQLIILFICVGLVPLLVVASISYLVYFRNIISVTIDTANYNVDWVIKNINQYFLNVEKITTLVDSKNVNHFLREEKDTPADSWELLSLFEIYRRNLYDEDSVQNITILGLNGKCQNERDGYYRLDSELIMKNPLIEKILNLEDNETLLQPAHRASYRKGNTKIETIPLGRTILDTSTLEVLGVIIIDLYPEKTEKFYRGVQGNVIGQMELIYNPGIQKVDTPISPISFLKLREGLSLHRGIDYAGWYLCYDITYQELIEPVRGVLQLTLIILFFSVILIIFVFFFISQRIIAPLKLLRIKMGEAAGGNFSARLDIMTDDQVIGGLCSSFNKMVFDLENLMRQKKEEHNNYLQAHFRMLQ